MNPGSWKRLIILLSCVYGGCLASPRNNNPHQPMTLTWQVLSQAGDPIWSISKVAPPWTWWPSLYPDICKLAFGAPANWDMEGYSDPDMKAPNVPSPPGRYGLDPWGGCGHPSRRSQLRTLPFYICPGFHRAVALNPTCVGGKLFLL